MTDDERDDAQADDGGEPFTAEELAQLTSDGIDPATAHKVGGQLFYWHAGVGTEVVFEDDGGEPAETVVVPTDRMPGATEDDIKLAAMQHRDDVKALEALFTPEQIESAVADLEAAGIFRVLVDMSASIIRKGVVVSVTHDPDAGDPTLPDDLPDDLTDDERRRVAERATVLMHEEAAEALTRICLTGEGAPAFKRDFARDLMAESWAWALADAREIADELEAKAGEAMPPEAFTELHHYTYQEGTYWTRALLDHTHRAALTLAEQAARAFSETPDLPHELTQAALRGLRGGGDSPGTASPPMSLPPGFKDGWGWVPNDPLHRTAVEAMQAAADNRGWLSAPSGRPYYASPGWAGTLSVADEGAYATAEAAWAVVKQLDDNTADVFDVALAHWLANHRKDPEGLVYITANEILAQRGRKQKKHRGYELTDKQAVSLAMQALAALEVEGRNFVRYEKTGKGRSRKVTIAPVGRLIEVPVREDLKHLDGTRGPTVGWYYRAGRWSTSFQNDAGTPMLAKMMQTVIALDPYQNRHAKRLGRYLTWQFRVRASSRKYEQPWTIGTLLAGAGIIPPDDNPDRFCKRIESALNRLARDHVIESWHYPKLDPLPARNWLPHWLEWHIVILPPPDLRAKYAPIGRRRLGGKKGPQTVATDAT